MHKSGAGEADIDEKIGEFETLTNPTVGLAAHTGVVDIRIAAKAETEAEAERMIVDVENQLRERLGHLVFGVDEDTLALDVVDRVGPGNHYLKDEHTLRYMRTEYYFPSDVINRQSRHDWEADGAKDARSRAKEIARRILAEHEPTPIDPDVDAWIKGRFA